ncbi:AAA family ATPase [Chryseobacterium sp. L7]|uniref:AAA family ATPase n=1 Tax=Chryseobacterium endalhagicum TaxID=2797638 RepID=A0ABS1QCG5_9FLAO|nr:AAA family ATPase [Chryseobacterium endalhagicum]MBL1220297.1 AAA family ATPase [Chryseobacterium endalhagicum]
MKYWHLQMCLPYGRKGGFYDSRPILKHSSALIASGEWESHQCINFKNFEGDGLDQGDIVLVREGKRPLALVRVLDDIAFYEKELEQQFRHNWFRKVNILKWFEDDEDFPQPQGTLQILNSPYTDSYKYIHDRLKQITKETKMKEITDLLKYKNQIILQGPPGTGKTKLAKEIAEALIDKDAVIEKPDVINADDIKKLIKIGQRIKTVGGRGDYEIKEINNDTLLISTSGEDRKPTINGVISFYKNHKNGENWNTTDLSNVQLYEMAIAKYISEFYDSSDRLANEDSQPQFKLLQFHPSYTYEDFVRGIVAESKGNFIEYKNVNKTLGLFAKTALDNYLNSKKDISVLSKEKWVDLQFDRFVEKIAEDLNNEKYFKLTDSVNIVDLEDDAFLYIGTVWKGYQHRMPFKDIKQAFLDGNTIRIELSKNANISGSARQHATYYVAVLKAFLEFIKDEKYSEEKGEVKLKNYVLVIDEINRANLSSVLGELIYALEYRGEKVDSMYSVEGSSKLVLPPNLYIIGTMNTADRSVGHIDYAIRRRFGFVDVLPKNLSPELQDDFDVDLFVSVSELFIQNYSVDQDYENIVPSEYLSSDFDPKEVWLGHSYFIKPKELDADMEMRLEYEIKPILREYVKDGILKESALAMIENLSTVK